mmetsp:Transcript_25330/g.53184  ORF Transcript_25330/g.53184 Transcript_25330/m.53184 type:complete len:82 (+) Transcript_25330:280-525(+)
MLSTRNRSSIQKDTGCVPHQVRRWKKMAALINTALLKIIAPHFYCRIGMVQAANTGENIGNPPETSEHAHMVQRWNNQYDL